MSEKEMHSFRLSSLEDPSDEMLETLMKQIGEAARKSMADAEVQRRLEVAMS